MNGFSGWLRQLGFKMKMGMSRFMAGRYGTDRLSMVILCGGLLVSLLSVFIRWPGLNLVLVLVSYGLMIWAIFRTLSRNTYKRYQENRRFMRLLSRLKDRKNRYFQCPKCRQTVRVPRGKGKISITCPKCRERFIKKT